MIPNAISKPHIKLRAQGYDTVPLSLSLPFSLWLSEITVPLAEKCVPSQADNGLCPTGL